MIRRIDSSQAFVEFVRVPRSLCYLLSLSLSLSKFFENVEHTE